MCLLDCCTVDGATIEGSRSAQGSSSTELRAATTLCQPAAMMTSMPAQAATRLDEAGSGTEKSKFREEALCWGALQPDVKRIQSAVSWVVRCTTGSTRDVRTMVQGRPWPSSHNNTTTGRAQLLITILHASQSWSSLPPLHPHLHNTSPLLQAWHPFQLVRAVRLHSWSRIYYHYPLAPAVLPTGLQSGCLMSWQLPPHLMQTDR